MQPWKISVGLTAIICAGGLMLAGEGFSWLVPYFWMVLTDYWFPVSWYARNQMKKTLPYTGAAKRGILIVALIGASSTELLAQGTSPWLQAIDVLQTAFTGPIARGLSLIAIVVGGLMFAFGEGGSKKALAGIVFGLGMAMGAANFMAWLF